MINKISQQENYKQSNGYDYTELLLNPLHKLILSSPLQGITNRQVKLLIKQFLGFLPIFLLVGRGSDVMQRIAAPMFGGLISSSVLTLLIIPSVYLLWLKWKYGMWNTKDRN